MPAQNNFDLIVIGAGPGGYVACIRGAQLGMRVACVERMPRPGGVCLNVGCIPSKCLLDSTEHYTAAARILPEHGILMDGLRFDLRRMMARKERVVEELCRNVQQLMEGHGVSIFRGNGRLTGPNRVDVTPAPEAEASTPLSLQGEKILLATGSEPVGLPHLPFDETRIASSTGALAWESVPERLAVVGGGYIGLELGSVWRRLGARVTVIEMMPSIAGPLDGQVARALHRILEKQGFRFLLGTRVTGAQMGVEQVTLELDTPQGPEKLDCERVLVAVGRRPLTRELGLPELGIQVHPKTGRIPVDTRYRTTVPSIYAIGDLVDGPMLAHKASAEAVAAVECMAGLQGEVNYDAVPAVIYTSPEVASVGMTEEQAKERGLRVCVGTYPFSGSGRGRCTGETDGFVKLIVHPRSDRILGAHIIGPRASDLIAECVLAMELHATGADLGQAVHGHPTFSEAIHEAVQASRKCSVYAP
ncbi:MAG: dihydrolipoyl dehydrogenase [Deltaproteobacteria bacterium]|nr:dihydrolipoyl dehydrogenase [Deltaproteobacteria bacterium]